MSSSSGASSNVPGNVVQPPASASADSSRAWIWVIVAAVALVSVVGLMIGGVFYLVFALMRSTGAYQQGLRVAQTSPCVVQRLGSPVTPGIFISGGTRTSNSDGSADLEFPLHGPKGSGRLHILASEVEGTWYIRLLTLKVDNERIELLPEPTPCP